MESEELDAVRADTAVASSSADTSDPGPIEEVSLSLGRIPTSEEYLCQLQANVLQDAFISSLICGENTAGDLPTEHRMHKNRKLKCRQSVTDYRNMTSAGVVDKSGTEKGSIRTLEEMLIEALPTPVFTHVLERRLAVISHTVNVLPVLSLFSFWSPTKKPPDKVLLLDKEEVEATSVTSSSDSHGAYGAVDGVDNTFWQSQPRPGVVSFVVKSTELEKVTSIVIHWHLKFVPQTVGVQYRPEGSDSFIQLVQDRSVSLSGPTRIETRIPPSCQEARIVMAGTPASNRSGTYAIEHLRFNMPAPGSLFADPKSTVSAIAHWLLGALDTADEVMATEAIGALRAWALSTASLEVTMLFVDLLLRFNSEEEDPRRRRIATLALEQGRLLLKGIKAYHREASQRLAHEGDKVAFGDVRRVAAVFESSVCSSGVVVEDGGLVVRTRETSYHLWMLRGYNGNLYARGHKLSRTIGKVHPGDIVQVDVDMGEGTLAYKINGTDYGVVFTDLAGHEVHPAVSFYGSGKHEGTPFFCWIRDVREGESIGYASNGDSNTLSVNAATGSTSIHINGEAKQRCLSTHPPSHGDAYVIYDLSEAYHMMRGAVAINDDTRNEILQNRGVSLVFKIVGDDKMLWQSKQMSETHQMEPFEVNVNNVRMLELKVSCSGSNHCAHAIWVDPCLHPIEEWTCSNCFFVNKGASIACTVCRNGTRDKSPPSVDVATSAGAASEAVSTACANLESIGRHDVKDPATELGVSSELVADLRQELEAIARIREESEAPDESLIEDIDKAAAQTIVAGISVLYPSALDKLELLLQLLRLYIKRPLDATSASYFVLSSVMKLLAAPGPDGILTFMPFMAAEVAKSRGASFKNAEEDPWLAAVTEATELLIQVVVKDHRRQLATDNDNSSHDGDGLSDEALCLLKTYQLYLLSEAIESTKTNAIEDDAASPRDANELRAKLQRRLQVQEATVQFGFLSLNAYRDLVDNIVAFQADESFLLSQTAAARQASGSEFPITYIQALYNVFHQLYTGEKDHFEGQIGFQFEATSSFIIVALGRSVNSTRHVTVGGSSKKDALGYALEMLPSPARITQGKLYRLTTQEFANGGDPWYKKENLPDEEYDESFIKILRDCYASGSVGFPGSQNMIGAAYGVPTFLVQDETPLASLPRFIPPHGCLSLRFNTNKKLNSVCISHTGTSAYVKDCSDTWRTCLLRTAFLHGLHSVDFALKCSRAGGTVSGHICVGVDWRRPQSGIVSKLSIYETFMGETPTSIGWMPSIGAVWVKGNRYDYGPKLSVAAGDIFTVVIDYDSQLLSFAYNGKNIGVAVGPQEFQPLGTTIEGLPEVVTAASLAGRIASTLIAGHPVDGVEEELLPWLQSPLLSGGIAESCAGQDQSAMRWSDALQAEYARYPSNEDATGTGTLAQNVENDSVLRKRGSGGRLEASEAVSQRDPAFWGNWTADMTERGIVQLIISWLEKHSPDRTFLSRLGRFPSCERWMCAALIMHAPSHVLQEVEAIAAGAGASATGEVVGADFFLAHADLTPSDDLIHVWKRIIMLRHWLIKARQEYRAKEADEPSPTNTPPKANLKRCRRQRQIKVMTPQSFDDLVKQVIQRAEFLCKLAPPSEEAERLKGDSQLALFNLAEKWSAQTTPPSLQPMLERWKTLGEADSSKWSGIVDVLRAQHRWRARRASIHGHTVPTTALQPTVSDGNADIEGSEDLVSKKYDYTNCFSAMMKACELYIRDGTGAPPEVLSLLLERRQRRSDSRLFGLQAMKSIISLLSYDSAIYNALIFLRPAMRGFTESEKESRELNDGQIVAETFRATVRHHYLKGLEGCNRQTIESIQGAFCDLYAYLAQLLGGSSGYSLSDPQLKQTILCAWSLDFEPRDHQFLLDTGMLSKHQLASSVGGVRSARSSSSGYMTKRDVIRLLHRAPHYACSAEWWKKNELDEESTTDAVPLTARHTASSLALLYGDMLGRLQQKLLGPPPRTHSSKVLLFGAKITPATGRGAQSSPNPKPDEVSYVEMPALGEVKDFTIEMWIFPTELAGYQALRCDNGVQSGSVYLELIGRHVQLAIPGNFPRERLFRSYQFRTFEWTHCAVAYDAGDKCVQLFVNGVLVEKMAYERVCSSVNFRDSRLGCWMSEVDAQGAALTNISAQRKFKDRSLKFGFGEYRVLIKKSHMTSSAAFPTEGPEARGFDSTISHCRWVPTSMPVFGNDALDSMSPNEWSRVLACICSFQCKVRSWLTTQFNGSVKLSKLVCEHDERAAIQKWSQLSRIDGDDGVDLSDSDDAYLSGHTESEFGAGNSQLMDATTSKLLSQWGACTDEQMIIRKQTRRCAWVVFRFLASTGICGAYERREGEAKSVAAVAKLKRKQRLQKAGSSSNVTSSVGGMTGSEATRAPSLGFTSEDVAARTAEAASDAAKSAATNRELEEPVLQTLWFSKEFHRKKRGASLRQYPSDVARGKSGFVNIHHAPSDLTGDSDVLEPLEVETHLFGVLLFMLSQSQQSPAITHLVRPHMLRGLLEMLRLASPRSQRVVKLLLRRICCSGSVKPSDVGAILGSESVLIDLLLDQVAESVCSTAAPMATHAVNVPASSALVGTDSSMASTESLSNPIGFHSGQISLVVASESVALLRRLLMEKQWQQGVADNLCNAIRNITPILARKKSGPPSPDTRASADRRIFASGQQLFELWALFAFLAPTRTAYELVGKSLLPLKELMETGPMSSHASTVRVAFHPTSSEIDFDPGHNVQDVKLSSLSPTEEICLPPTAAPLTLDMMPVILQLASLDETSVLKDFDSLWRLQIRSPLGFASTLAAMGFEFELCMAALEHSRDDPNLAVEWLMGDGAATYQERQEAQRLARASIAELADGEGGPGLTLEVKASELQNISGMPYCLAFCALELSNSDPNRAMEWLMEHGSNYAEKFDSLDLLTDSFSAGRTVVLEDRAAMEEIDQPDPLVTSSRRQDAIAAEYLGSAASTRNAELSYAPNADAMAVTLAPILAPGPAKPNSTTAARDASITAFSPLDPEYLTQNVLLTRYSADDGVLITFLNTESGAYEDEWHFPRDLRRIVRIYDEPLESVESIHRVALRTENALSTYYARRAVTALLCAFNSVGIATSVGQDLEDKPAVVLSSFSSEILSVVGEEGKSEDMSRHIRRTRQPSDTEAQEVASAYLGGGIDDHDGLLSSVLVKECVSHFVESTRMAGDGAGEASAVQEFRSLHPYFGRCEYARAVSVDSTYRCLRIVFDHRCQLGHKAKLTFFADPECEDRIGVLDNAMTTAGHLLPDLIIHSHQFWFRFTASEENATKDNGYGYRFQVKPMANIRWTKETEVLASPSLEWACWVLELLLNDATELVAHGAVHNRRVYGALVRYLRSPGAPFKGRVARLLQQLLHHPELFPADEVPELDALESISRLALTRAEVDRASGKVFLSAHLLQLVELSMMISSASTIFKCKLDGGSATSAPILTAPFDLPVPFERKRVRDSLNDISEVTRFLLRQTTRLPQHILVAIWLEVYGSSAVIETSHPYAAGTPLSGLVAFEGAQALRITFDSRCSLAPGQGQGMSRLELATFTLIPREDRVGETVKEIRSNRTYAGESGWPEGPISHDGNNLEYTFHADENAGDHFGFAATVSAVGIPKEKQIARATVQDMGQLLEKLLVMQAEPGQGDRWTQDMDLQLVDWVNNHVEPGASLPSTTPATTRHSVDLQPADIKLNQTLDALRCSQLLGLSLESLQLRALVEAAVEATNVPGETSGSSQQTARITLDRMQALESRDDREMEPSVSECFFAQAFRQLHAVDPALLRRQIDSKGRLFSVKFRGEEARHWQHRGMYLPNPKCTSPVAMQMFAFVGQLLGISLRTRGDFPFMLPSLVWKQLLGQTLTRSDLEDTDAMFIQMLDGIANCENDGISTEEEFATAFAGLELRFTASSCTGEEIELAPGERARLEECSAQVAAMARGFATLFPRRVLTLLTWQELEILACGSPKIDLELWQRHTRYDGYAEDDLTVQLFWEALAEFSDEQRADFVRFAWGRSRLPRGKWPQPFKLSKKGGRDATRSLPVAHTCFFSVELPPYTSRETMCSMLLATITFGLGGILMA
ncbi:Ubiquitin-associated domain [Phytophthora cactorum]|nr:Ubiquitin-associated domain [Phytophthora cactorum]